MCEVRVYLYNVVCARNGQVASHIVHLGIMRTICGAQWTCFKQSCHARFVMVYHMISYSSGHRGYIVLYYFMLCYIKLCYTMSYYIMSYHIMLFLLYCCWVGFKLFTKSWTWFPSFDCPDKWLIHYVSYYVKVRVSRLLNAWSI